MRGATGFTAMLGTRANILAALSGEHYTRIHIACHARAALLEGDSAYLEAADGPVYAAELARVVPSGPTKLVYLSTCQSAIGSLIPGENKFGLASSLLTGGSNVVVASMWAVPDESSRRLATNFWRAMAQGCSAPEALHIAHTGRIEVDAAFEVMI